jgi:3-keto-5-aminohexanoate cleavage enzyme
MPLIKMPKLIITIAPTGNVPTKELNPNSALTPQEIVDDIEKCQELGASVAHIHARDLETMKPTCKKEVFQEIIEEMNKRKLNIIKQASTGARGGGNTVDWRGNMLDIKGLEMASLTTGSSNFPTSVNANSPELIEGLIKKMDANNLKPEIEAFDTAVITNAVKLEKKGILRGPLHFNMVMGVPGSVEATPRHLMFMVNSLPKNATWTVSGIGRSQIQMLTMSILMGGHVRTGLEDTILYKKGVLATNAMLVERIVRIAKELGREIATPDEAREIMGLNDY